MTTERGATPGLSPCPFCGSTKLGFSFVSNTGGNVQFVMCSDCHAHGPWADIGVGKKREAEWNKRTGSETTDTRFITEPGIRGPNDVAPSAPSAEAVTADTLLDYARLDLTEAGGTRSMVECDKERLLGLLAALTRTRSAPSSGAATGPYCPPVVYDPKRGHLVESETGHRVRPKPSAAPAGERTSDCTWHMNGRLCRACISQGSCAKDRAPSVAATFEPMPGAVLPLTVERIAEIRGNGALFVYEGDEEAERSRPVLQQLCDLALKSLQSATAEKKS